MSGVAFLTAPGISGGDATSVLARYAATAGLENYEATLFKAYQFVKAHCASGVNPNRTTFFSRLAEGPDRDRDGSNDIF